jgi:hypothetical protein
VLDVVALELAGADLPLLPALGPIAAAAEPPAGATPGAPGPGDVLGAPEALAGLETLAESLAAGALAGPAVAGDAAPVVRGGAATIALALEVNVVPLEDPALVFPVVLVSSLPVLLSAVELLAASDVLGAPVGVCACDPGGPADCTIGCHWGPAVTTRANRNPSVLRSHHFGQGPCSLGTGALNAI